MELTVDSPFFVKQKIHNACGTIALLHALCNNIDIFGGFRQDSFLELFYSLNQKSTPDERADYLNTDTKLEETHQEAAMQGETRPQDNDSQCHFVTYIRKDKWIWEMDGRLYAPVKKV